jgi:hypothetical protein
MRGVFGGEATKQEQIEYFFALPMDERIIIDLMTANADNGQLVTLCTGALADIKSNEPHFKLSQYLQKHSIPAEEYLEKFHDLCYIWTSFPNFGRVKEWRDSFGKAHCLRKDKNDNILPARISREGSRFWCKDGKPFSPGFDKDGYSLPTQIECLGSRMWQNEEYQNHRIEFDKDGKPLPARICGGNEYKIWYVNDVNRSEKYIEERYVSLNDVKRIIF